MPLEAGTKLGPYEIAAQIGAGGMGEVYRARDPKLDREVAIKVLPEAFAEDGERLARFEREAKSLAALNHPNVATVHGFEADGATHFLVMELAPGEDLSERIARGKISLDEALPLFLQIAEGLEAAHAQGIVHRDLKPGNVKVSPEGAVKILDFGLAKAVQPSAPSAAHLSQSPTLTVEATVKGQILGTAAYMSPEQARGGEVDARSDIWAFGVVLFEALSGQPAFGGESVTDILASVVKDEPDWTLLPDATPPSVRRLLRRCLEKPVRSRLQAIGDARIELTEALAQPSTQGGEMEGLHLPPRDAERTPGRAGQLAAWSLTALLALALAWALSRSAPEAPGRHVQLSVELAPGVRIAEEALDTSSAAVLSPDGRRLAFVGKATNEAPQLYLRDLDQLEATPVPGTEAANSPFFSPDGQWVAFFAGDQLKKVPAAGGAPVLLAEVQRPYGGSWGDDDTIIYAARQGTGLERVSASGGEPERLTSRDDFPDEHNHGWPQHLAGGALVLYSVAGTFGRDDNGRIVLEDTETHERKVLLQGGFHGRYVESGHLLYVYLGTLYAVELRLGGGVRDTEVVGSPFPVLEGVWTNSRWGGAQYALSKADDLVYVRSSDNYAAPVHWARRSGETSLLYAESTDWENPAFSPDGARLSMTLPGTGTRVLDLERGTLSSPPTDSLGGMSAWSPDGQHLVFSSRPGTAGPFNLYLAPADGSREPRRLTESDRFQFSLAWHPAGRFLAFAESSSDAGWNVRLLEMEPDPDGGWRSGQVSTLLDGPANEFWTAFSPDGEWVAYSSQETGRREIYVRRFPGPGPVLRVSRDGGAWPVWSRARNELLFGTQDGRIMVVSYEVRDGEFVASRPEPWTDKRFIPGQPDQYFDLHPDGERVALRLAVGDGAPSHVVLVTDLFGRLRDLTGRTP